MSEAAKALVYMSLAPFNLVRRSNGERTNALLNKRLPSSRRDSDVDIAKGGRTGKGCNAVLGMMKKQVCGRLVPTNKSRT